MSMHREDYIEVGDAAYAWSRAHTVVTAIIIPAGAAARGLLSLELAGENLIVARTEPGLASAVAVDIDGAAVSQIVGTLAGEDTIFVAVRDQKGQRIAMKKIWELFG